MNGKEQLVKVIKSLIEKERGTGIEIAEMISETDIKVRGLDYQYKVQVAKAFIVLREGIEDTPEIRSKIRSHCEQNLVQYSWPYAYEFRKELPKTLVGKVAFNVLMEEEKIKNGNTKLK